MPEYLLERLASGESEAFREFLKCHGAIVWSMAVRMIGRKDAEDAVQDIFLEIWKKADQFDGSRSSERTYVTMVARRRLIDRLRRRSDQFTSSFETLEAEPPEFGDDTSSSDRSDELAKVQSAMKQLSSDEQSAIRLSIHLGWSHQQIADQLRMPLGTVKTHIRRGLNKVREILNQLPGAQTEVMQ